MTVAIRIDKLGKRYRLGELETRHDTIGAAVGALLKSPIRNYRRLRSMSRFSADDESNVLWALRDVSFQVPTGQAIGIIGKNGAGKSTLLKILSRITPPSTGRILLNGRVASLLEVGTGFHPEQTGRENIFLNGAILGMKAAEIQRQFDEIVAFSGVEKFIDTPVKFYSSGMRVRLAFSVAAHLDPEILLIDEVLAVGDAEFQRKCLGKMHDVTGEGRTVFFVSHNMAAIESLCDRAVLLQHGSVVYDGDVREAVGLLLSMEGASYGTGLCDLSNHPRRVTPPEQAVFRSMRTLQVDGAESTSFALGTPVVFEINLDAGAEELESPMLSLVVERQGTTVCILNTSQMVKTPFVLQGPTTVRLTWDPGWLAGGLYSVARLGIKRRAYEDRLDGIEDILSFEIVARDVYGTGRTPSQRTLLTAIGTWDFMKVE